MSSLIVRPAGLMIAAVLISPLGPDLGARKGTGDAQAELKNLQGLWQHIPGEIEQENGEQIVRGPAADGPCFFVRGDKLIWLDKKGKPSGEEETITVDPTADPKRIKFTKQEKDGQVRVLREGIYRWERVPGVIDGQAAEVVLTIDIALQGKPPPTRFLELNRPIKGVDGCQGLVNRVKLHGK